MINHQRNPTQDRSDRLVRPVRPVRAEIMRRPKIPSSGGTPSELGDLGLSWSRQATQDAFKRCLDARITAKGLEKLGFGKKDKETYIDSIVVRKPSIGHSLYIYRPGGRTPSKSDNKRTIWPPKILFGCHYLAWTFQDLGTDLSHPWGSTKSVNLLLSYRAGLKF